MLLKQRDFCFQTVDQRFFARLIGRFEQGVMGSTGKSLIFQCIQSQLIRRAGGQALPGQRLKQGILHQRILRRA